MSIVLRSLALLLLICWVEICDAGTADRGRTTEALRAISDAADALCSGSDLSGEAKLKLTNLNKRLADLGYTGTDLRLQSELASRLSGWSRLGSTLQCRQSVFEELSKPLFPPDPGGPNQNTTGDCSPVIKGTDGNVFLSCHAAPNSNILALTEVDSALSKLVEGNAAFNVPDQATIGKAQIIEARLSVSKTPSDLISELTGPGKKETSPLRVGDKMAATLKGADAFDVSPSGSQIQLISHKDTTVWTWTIIPKQSGTQFLILSFDAFLTIDGKEGTRTINTLTRKIDVRVGWPETLEEWLDYGKKLFEGLSWLWATILLPLVAYTVHLWKRRKGSPDTDGSARAPPHGDRKGRPARRRPRG